MLKYLDAEFIAETKARGVKTWQERLFLVWFLAGIRVEVMEGLGKSPILSVILANLADSIGLEGSDELCVHKPLNTCRETNLTVWTFLRFNTSNCYGAKFLAPTRLSTPTPYPPQIYTTTTMASLGWAHHRGSRMLIMKSTHFILWRSTLFRTI